MRRFAKTLSVSSSDSDLVDLFENNLTCHRAGSNVMVAAGLWLPAASTPTIDDVSKSAYIIVNEAVYANTDNKTVLDAGLTGGSVVAVYSPTGEVPTGYKVAVSRVCTDTPADFTADVLILTNVLAATEAQISAWLTFIADKNVFLGAGVVGTNEAENTTCGLLIGADFIVGPVTSETKTYHQQFDLFVGTKTKSITISGSDRVIVTDSHTVHYDTSTYDFWAVGDLAIPGDNTATCNQQVLVRTAATSTAITHAAYFSYTENMPLQRYVQFKTAAPASLTFKWELSNEINLVASPSTLMLVDNLPEWMTWRTNPRSTGYQFMEAITQLTDDMQLAAFEVRYAPTDMPISLMNGVADEEYIGGDGYIDPAEELVTLYAQANSAEELIYSPVAAYLWVDGYLVTVRSSTDTINLWTPLDEWGAYAGLKRHTGETLTRFRLRVLDAFQSVHGAHKDAFIKTIVRELMPPTAADPDAFEQPTDVTVLPLTDRQLFTNDNLPGELLIKAVEVQKTAGQHVYDDGVMGHAVWNADGPSHEGGARLAYQYDTPLDLIDDFAASGTGPEDDCKVIIEDGDPVDATVTVKKTVYASSNGTAGIYPVSLAVAVKATGSYSEYVTPPMRARIKVSLYIEALDVQAYSYFTIEGDSSKNAVNNEGNENIYQTNIVDPSTGALEGVWKYTKDAVEYILTEAELAAAWDPDNFGPVSNKVATDLFKIEVSSIYRMDTNIAVASGCALDVLEENVFNWTTRTITSVSTNKTGYAYFEVKFKDDLGTETINWESDTFQYELHRNNVYDSLTDAYLEDGDTVTITTIPVPSHISNATTTAALISATADLNDSVTIDPAEITVGITDGVLSSSVATPANIRYGLKQHTATTTTSDTITVNDLAVDEVRQFALASKVAGAVYNIECNNTQVNVAHNPTQHLITVSRARTGSVLVNPGWFWLGVQEGYFYTDIEEGVIDGLEHAPSGSVQADSMIYVDGYTHRYGLTPLGAKTFGISVDVEVAASASDLYVPDKDIIDVVVKLGGTTVEGCSASGNIISLPAPAPSGSVYDVDYTLNNSFYYDWATNKIMLSNAATAAAYKIQKSSKPYATSLNISPHDCLAQSYFIVLDDTDTVVPTVEWTVASRNRIGVAGEPVCVVVRSRYDDGSVAPDVSYDLEVTNGVCAGELLGRKTGSDGADVVDIWPTNDVTVVVKSGSTTLGTITIPYDTSNQSSPSTGARIEIDAPSAMRMNYPATVSLRAWAALGDPDESAAGTWALTCFELGPTGEAVGTAYAAVTGASGSLTTDSLGMATIAIAADKFAKRGAYKLTVTINGITEIAVWRIY